MNVFVGRQPIFDRNLRTYAYELLFRSGAGNHFDGTDAVSATSTVVANTFLSIGADRILGDRRGFVNFPRELLVDQGALALPSHSVVIEILETVTPDEAVLRGCRRLKDAGFLLALDDFVHSPEYLPLVDLADFVKVDFRATPRAQCRALALEFGRRDIRMLAEKVETQEEVEQARDMGYAFYQGYFFAKPQIIAARDVPRSKLNCLRILREVHAPALDFARLEDLIRVEVSLAHSLLRYVNSAAFGLRRRIECLRHALVVLGEREVRKVVSLAALPALASDKPHELTRICLNRGRLCENVAAQSALRARAPECFLMGMFSLLDAMIGRPLDEVLGELGLAPDVCAALTRDPPPATPLASVFALCRACEAADPAAIARHSRSLGLAPETVSDLFLEALCWSESVLQV
ncbi:MAG: HDOD domain-containing protein [Acidobacteria bacterium]|nr:HDOD domain-containing protein [Acidobacteriota bacterium]